MTALSLPENAATPHRVSMDDSLTMSSDELRDLHRRLDSIVEQLDSLTTILRGTPEKPVGIVVRVDRLEQSEKQRSKREWIYVTGLIGAGFALLVEAVRVVWPD